MMKADLIISHGGKIYYPIVEEGISVEWARKGVPGKLSFTVIKDDTLVFEEGDHVELSVDGKNFFYGFVFTKTQSGKSPRQIDVTVYDQLRYFKNKDTYFTTNKTAAELLRMIAGDFRLNVGTIEDTGYKIESIMESDTTLFDIVYNALDETLAAKKKLYVLYDDVGKLMLKNIENMTLNLLFDGDSVGDYTYTSSIDSQTYNQVKVVYEDSGTGVRKTNTTRDISNINRWGLLQLTEKVEDSASGQAKADALLGLYNSKTRNLSFSDALGDLRVRAGSSVIVKLVLNDMTVQSYLVVEQVKHKFMNNQHLMDLKLRGGGFVA